MNKIILFGPYPPPYGGVAIYVSTLHEFLKQLGFDCELKVYRQSRGSYSDNVQPTFMSLYKNFSKVTSCDTCIDSSSFFLEYPSCGSTFAWLSIKLFKRFKWLKIIHDGSLPVRHDAFTFVQKLLFKLSIRFIDEFIVVSKGLYEWLQKDIRVRKRVSLINSLLPIAKPTINTCLPIEIDQFISHYEKLVTSVGVFIPNYGFEHIANAVEVMRREFGTDIGLLLIDGSFANDEAYKSTVLKNRKWVIVLKNVPHGQVLQILKKSDVFVRGVAFESYGLSRIEALWSGVPVVATRVGETRGMLLYNFGKEEELIQQIKKALFDPPTEDVKAWRDYFSREANDNLMAMIRLIDPGGGQVCLAE